MNILIRCNLSTGYGKQSSTQSLTETVSESTDQILRSESKEIIDAFWILCHQDGKTVHCLSSAKRALKVCSKSTALKL